MNPLFAYAPHIAEYAADIACQATETTDERCFRLGLMAVDKDAEAARHWANEADAAGRATGRRLAGNDDEYAAGYDREVHACKALALDAEAEANRLRSQCASLRKAQRFADEVISHCGERS